jgi:YVTN family beta-propeller protein
VGTSPTGIAYDSGKGEVFVANSGFNTISVISDSTNAVVATVTVGTSPAGVAYDSGKGEVYVTNRVSNSVSVISDNTNAVVATVAVGTTPNNIAYDSSKGEVFVVNSGANTVSVISDTTNAVVATVPVGTSPYKVVYDSSAGEVFVANSGFNTVSIISDSTNTVVATVTVGGGPAGEAYDSGMGEVFVANSVPGTVSVISDSTNAVVATVTVGATPYGVIYDAGLGEVFVCNSGAGTVSVISDSTNAVVATIAVGAQPTGAAYDSGKGEIFVTNTKSGTVSVISDVSGTSPSPTPATSPSSSPVTSASPTPVTSATPSPTAKPTSSPAQTTVPPSTPSLLQQVWVPPPANAVATVAVTAVVVSAVSAVFAALNNPLGAGGKVGEKTKGMIPDNLKQWLEEVVSSRREVDVAEKTGSVFKPTKPEALAYVTAVIVLAVSFSYVKVITLGQIWELLPVFFATSVLVAFVQKFFSIAFLRSRGVWSEHKIWPLGLVLFLVTTFAFKVPFSSPTRNVHQTTKITERLEALASTSEILIGLAFAGLFFLLLLGDYTAIGGAGLAMCVIGSFFGTFPVAPMSGKDIFDYSKRLWAGLFIATLILFVAWLMLL